MSWRHHLLVSFQESEKKRQEERLQQQRWQEQHKQAMRAPEHEYTLDPEMALRRFWQIRHTGRPDWVTVEFDSDSTRL